MSNKKLLLIETMPDHLKGSHREARNWGVYPHNGAERVLVEDGEVYDFDFSEYGGVLREATELDLERYQRAFAPH